MLFAHLVHAVHAICTHLPLDIMDINALKKSNSDWRYFFGGVEVQRKWKVFLKFQWDLLRLKSLNGETMNVFIFKKYIGFSTFFFKTVFEGVLFHNFQCLELFNKIKVILVSELI